MLIENIILDKQECEKILSNLNESNFTIEKFKFRSRKKIEFKYVEENDWFMDKIFSYFEKQTNFKIKSKDMEHMYLKYSVNDFFGAHNDVIKNRIFGIEILLSEDFDGGEMTFDFFGKKIINKKIGNCVLYNTNIPYEINKITNGCRNSILIYILDYHLDYGEIKTLI